MRRLKHLLILTVLTGKPLAAPGAPPANDDLSLATVLAGLPTTATGTNIEATRQPVEPNSPLGYDKASVWWQWTAPSSGWVEVNTLGSSFDTGLAVYTGTEVEALNLVKYNDGTLRTDQSRLRFEASTGILYHIQVQGWFGASGDIKLEIKPAQAPQPPVLQNMTLSEQTLVYYTGPITSEMALTFNARDGLDSAELILTGPRGNKNLSHNFRAEYLKPIRGDIHSGTMSMDIWGNSGIITTDGGPSRAYGDWSISIILTDTYGETRQYGGEGNPPLPAGSPGILHILSDSPLDVAPPVIVSATVSQQTIDVTDSDQYVDFEVNATDDAGLDLLASFQVELINPQGDVVSYESTGVVTGTETNATVIGRLLVPKYTSAGVYHFTFLAADKNGISDYIDTSTGTMRAGISKSITIVNEAPPDVASPALVSLSTDAADPARITTPQLLTITVGAADNVGVEYVRVGLNDGQVGAFMSLTGGSKTAGVWTGELNLPSNFVAGTHVLEVVIKDAAGNLSAYGKSVYGRNQSNVRSFPDGALRSISITPGPGDAYSVWQSGYPELTTVTGHPDADPDGDGIPNSLEFMCGTHPLLPSGPDGSDPQGTRAPVFSLTPDFLQLEYCLSQKNLSLGSGSYWNLQPVLSENLKGSQRSYRQPTVTKDLRRFQFSRANRPTLFAWLSIFPSFYRVYP